MGVEEDPGGGLFHYTAFVNDFAAHAAVRAGWAYQDWHEIRDRWDAKTQTYVRSGLDRRQFHLTWYSLRHRFARTSIDIWNLTPGELMSVGGWENETVVKNRYYNAGAEHRSSAAQKYR